MCTKDTRGECRTLGQLFAGIEERLDRIEAKLDAIIEHQDEDDERRSYLPHGEDLCDGLLHPDETELC